MALFLMKKFLILIFAVLILGFLAGNFAQADAVYVRGYYKNNGTYIQPYYRSRANAYTYDNYSYKSPSYSNGYGYNSSYYSGRSYSSNWYTPSYSDSDYYTGLNSYNSSRSYRYNSYLGY